MAKKPIRERILSPVNDPGYWPYDRRAGEMADATEEVTDVPDPMGFCPPLPKDRTSGEE